MSARPLIGVVLACALLACTGCTAGKAGAAGKIDAAGRTATGARRRSTAAHWVGTWSAPQQIPEPSNALPPAELRNATLRQIVHLSLGGSELRVRLSNVFGTRPLHIESVHVATPVSLTTGAIDSSTDKALTFNGRPEVTIPAGAVYYSDPVGFDAPALSNLAITLYLKRPPARQSSHPGSREISFLVHGEHVAAATLPGARRFAHWFFICGVDVLKHRPAAAVVVLGDSLTDGHATANNSNSRWTDDLARRLARNPATGDLGVLNAGLGGNRLLLNGLGPNALARVDRDVLSQTGARYLIVLEGVNDLGTATMHRTLTPAQNAALVRRIIGAYKQIILRAHAEGMAVMGGTIPPFMGSTYYHPSAATEADREKINAWIRAPGHFDAVAHFARVLRDPSDPHRLRPAYDSGDNLHPSPLGYRVMAEAVPLSFFTRCAPARGGSRAGGPGQCSNARTRRK